MHAAPWLERARSAPLGMRTTTRRAEEGLGSESGRSTISRVGKECQKCTESMGGGGVADMPVGAQAIKRFVWGRRMQRNPSQYRINYLVHARTESLTALSTAKERHLRMVQLRGTWLASQMLALRGTSWPHGAPPPHVSQDAMLVRKCPNLAVFEALRVLLACCVCPAVPGAVTPPVKTDCTLMAAAGRLQRMR